MKLLLTGARGLLGTEVLALARARGHEIVGIDIEDVDITDSDATSELIHEISPEVVLHCAAYTAVDRAEEEPELAMSVNRDGARNVAEGARSVGALIATTIGTCFGVNALAADQYMAIVLPGRMFKDAYAERGLHEKNLTRTLEDAGTITSPLVPWNTCGAYMSATLGVATLAYLPFCFFNLVNPFIAMAYGFTGFKIEPAEATKGTEAAVAAR